MNLILKGSTDVTRYVMLVDSTAGTPETGYTITDLDLQYTRNRTAPASKVDATALAATDSAHSDNKAIQVDATSSPGLYRVDWPDAAFASGVDKVILVVSGSGLHPAVEEIQLVSFNPEDAVRLGLTALPNAAADAAGGLIISDAGGLDADAQLVTKINAILEDTGTTLDDFLDSEITAIKTKTDLLPSVTAGAVGGLPILGAFGEVNASVELVRGDPQAAENLLDALDGTGYNVGGGSIVVDSVTGAVASVTVVSDKTGYSLSEEGAEALLDPVVETDEDGNEVTVRRSHQLSNSNASGLVSGAGTGTVVLRNLANTEDLVTATVDANANRTAVTRNFD